MASLHMLVVLLVLGVAAAESVTDSTGYNFDYRRHLQGMDAQAHEHDDHDGHEHHVHEGTDCSHDAHQHAHDVTVTDDDDDSEEGRSERSAQHTPCSFCGGEHLDADHHKHHAHAHAGHSGHHAVHHGHHDKHYRFRVGMDMPRTGYLYVNEAGRLEGFILDLIANVCKTAGHICHPVHDLKDMCWKAYTDSPGTGLVSGWYDGCVGFFPTPEMYDAFDFSLPFSLNPILALYFTANKVPADPTFLKGKKIGFLRGLPMNAACLRRLSVFRGTFHAVQFDSMPQLIRALTTNKIDAFPWMANLTAFQLPAVRAGPTFTCASQGLSVMARKGDHLVSWWDEAYKKLIASGEYAALCRRTREKLGSKGRVFCLDP